MLWEISWHTLDLLFDLLKLINLPLFFLEFSSFILILQLFLLFVQFIEHFIFLFADFVQSNLL